MVEKGRIPVMDASASIATPDARGMSREALFEALVIRERERAVRIAYHLVGGDTAQAEDLAQEAFLRAFQALPTFRGEAALSSWFTRILLNQAASYRRRQWVRQKWLSLWQQDVAGISIAPPVAAGTVSAPPGDPAMRRRLRLALKKLSAAQLQAFTLVHLEGMSLAESAAAMNLAVGTVKSHLHRAIAKLKKELGDLKVE